MLWTRAGDPATRFERTLDGEDACEPSFNQVIPYQDTGTARHFCQGKPRYGWSVQSQMLQEDGSQFVRKYSEKTGSDRPCGY